MCRRVLFPCVAGLVLFVTVTAREGPRQADARTEFIQAIRANSYQLRLHDGRLEGPGTEQLVGAGQRAQFVVLAEEHYVSEIPQITTALLLQLQRYGYQYVATESGTVHARLASLPPMRGNRDAVLAFAQHYPFSLTFFSDEEARMMAEVGSISRGNGNPIWGIDQEFGALHVLERILTSAPSAEARQYTEELIHRAREFELDREKLTDKTHFIAAVLNPPDLDRLNALYATATDQDVKWMIGALVASNRIYNHFVEARYYLNSHEREQYMKKVFLDEYRRALSHDKSPPRVIVKAGHWHALKGLNPAGVLSLGSFLSEFATMNGLDSYHVAVYVHGPKGHWRGMPKNLALFAEACDSNRFTLVDLRAIRPQLRRFRSVLSTEERDNFFKADALLILGGARPHSTHELSKNN